MGSPGHVGAFDNAAVLVHHLGHQGQAQAGTLAFVGDKGVEQIGHDIFRHARSIVVNGNFDGQLQAALGTGHGQAQAMAKGGAQGNFTAPGGRRLGRVLDQIQQHLHQLVKIAPHRRNGRIVFFVKADVLGKAALRHLADPFQNPVDIDRLVFNGPVREHLHAFHNADDAIGFIAD